MLLVPKLATFQYGVDRCSKTTSNFQTQAAMVVIIRFWSSTWKRKYSQFAITRNWPFSTCIWKLKSELVRRLWRKNFRVLFLWQVTVTLRIMETSMGSRKWLFSTETWRKFWLVSKTRNTWLLTFSNTSTTTVTLSVSMDKLLRVADTNEGLKQVRVRSKFGIFFRRSHFIL